MKEQSAGDPDQDDPEGQEQGDIAAGGLYQGGGEVFNLPGDMGV